MFVQDFSSTDLEKQPEIIIQLRITKVKCLVNHGESGLALYWFYWPGSSHSDISTVEASPELHL